jgi:uncharacterized protein YciI
MVALGIQRAILIGGPVVDYDGEIEQQVASAAVVEIDDAAEAVAFVQRIVAERFLSGGAGALCR